MLCSGNVLLRMRKNRNDECLRLKSVDEWDEKLDDYYLCILRIYKDWGRKRHVMFCVCL